MDRNTIIGIILIFLIFFGFSVYNNSMTNKRFRDAVKAAETEIARGNPAGARMEYYNALSIKPGNQEILAEINDINALLGVSSEVQPENVNREETPVRPVPVPQETMTSDSATHGIFAGAARGDDELITLENDLLEMKIALKGGRIYSARLKKYVTHDSLPLFLFSGDSTVFGFIFSTEDNRVIQTNNLFFTAETGTRSYVVTDQPQSVILRLNVTDEKYIEYKYTMFPGKYSLQYEVTFRNMQGIIPQNLNYVSLDWRMYIPQQEKGRDNEDNYTTIKYKYFDGDVESLKLRSQKETETVDLNTQISWVAFQDQFFSSIVITDSYFVSGSVSSMKTPLSKKYLRYFTTGLRVPFVPGPESKIDLRLYFGPNHISTLRKEGLQLEKIVFLGKNIIGWISRFVIIPVFNWLEKYIGSYGLIILILTVLIKIVLFPLTFKSYQSTAKMAVLKPMVDELAKKFPKKEDAMKKQQATMDLYKRAGVSPMGGCLPTLLQFPILFAMFRFFPVSIELRQEHFLWATDLSTYDSILTLPFTIPLYGDHVSLFTLLMTASSLLTMKMSGTSTATDQPGMKIMMYMMPVMFMLILNKFSAGLTYYYFLANMLTWVQNIISKRFINADKVLATLETNKKKPVPKSKWQQRLEAAARQRGINPPRK